MASVTNRPSLGVRRRARHAESRAISILEDLGIREAPVQVEQIALRLGLQVEHALLGDEVSGLLVIQDENGMIGVNASHAPVRQRFTIAHEIGHFLLHRKQMPVFIDKQFFKPYFAAFRDSSSAAGEDRLEIEANAFAAALLMPATFVRSAIAELRVNIADDEAIDELAKRFLVSRQAMTFRVANLATLGTDSV